MTDAEKIDSLQKQLDLTNANYNVLNEQYYASKKENKELRTENEVLLKIVDRMAGKLVIADLTKGGR